MTPLNFDISSLASSLPISECLTHIEEALNTQDTAILEAPPGAGKTTIVPLALLNANWLKQQTIVMLQPRRVAARAAAFRMASLLNERVGDTVGYHIRNEKKFTSNTRIIVMTEGILTRRLQYDPELNNVGCVIFDEFHERNLDADLGLAFCLFSRELMREENNPLKLLVMSATLEGLPLSEYLNHPPLIKSEGRSFPVDIHYQNQNMKESDFLAAMEREIKNTLNQNDGDILAFLPGLGEIRRLQENLELSLPPKIKIFPLHGSLNQEQQQAAIQPKENESFQKIILATDIAETSVTIDGVTTVIDSGFSRGPIYDPKSGLTRLTTRRISKASATQRAGRAGRTGPGKCIRMWSRTQQENLLAHYPADILSADLCPLALQLLAWGVNNVNELQWLNAPPSAAYQQSLDLLVSLGAIEMDNQGQNKKPGITKLGERMSELPVHPRLSKMLIQAEEMKHGVLACNLAAILSERDRLQNQGADIACRLELIHATTNKRSNETTKCPRHLMQWKQRVQQQSVTLQKLIKTTTSTPNTFSPEDIATLLVAAYPDRIAKQVSAENAQYKIANGRMALLDKGDILNKKPWIVAVEIGGYEGKKEDRIFVAAELNPELFNTTLKENIEEQTHCYWSEKQGKFISEKREMIGEITLSTTPIKTIDPEQRISAICTFIQKEGLSLLNWTAQTKQWQQRVMLARKHFGSEWPDVSDEHLINTLGSWLPPYLQNAHTLNDLKGLDIATILLQQLNWEQQSALNTLAPTHIEVPSGSKISIDYSQSPPVLSVKLQEMFGCNTTPSVLNGKEPLLIHLLSPARRPIQITQDLAGFWQSSYESVKKEMKGRYPKHPWPDDPTTAIATSRTKKAIERKP